MNTYTEKIIYIFFAECVTFAFAIRNLGSRAMRAGAFIVLQQKGAHQSTGISSRLISRGLSLFSPLFSVYMENIYTSVLAIHYVLKIWNEGYNIKAGLGSLCFSYVGSILNVKSFFFFQSVLCCSYKCKIGGLCLFF